VVGLPACAPKKDEGPDHEPVPRHALRSEIVGCYALFTGQGRRLDASFYNSSPVVRLESAVRARFDSNGPAGFLRIMVRLDTAGHRVDPISSKAPLGPSWWADSATDSVRFSFSNGFSGALVVVNAPPRAGDTLLGRIEEDWDFGPPFATDRGRGKAVRTRCAGA